nr:hypothetical protein CFP56_44959 [Quercus suber]
MEKISDVDNGISITLQQQHVLGNSIMDNSKELIGNKSEEHIRDLPGGLVMTHEFGSVNMVNNPDKEKSATTTMNGNEPDQFDQSPHHAIWKPPPWPILKVNSDDAIFREQNPVDVVLDMGGGLVLFWRSTIDVIVEGSESLNLVAPLGSGCY